MISKMNPWKKTTMLSSAVLLFWIILFILCLMNWGNITVNMMEKKYALKGYPQTDIVLAGSSSIQLWKTSAADIGPLTSENVGIGGSVISNWEPWIDKLITPFNPKAVILYIGANDLHNNKTEPNQAFEELEALIDALHATLPETKIFYVSVYTTAAHETLIENDVAFGNLVSNYADEKEYLTYIDCTRTFIDSEDNLYKDDGVHLNDEGYEVWIDLIKQALITSNLYA